MKFVLAAIAACTLFSAQQSHAYPTATNVSGTLNYSGSSGRLFDSGRTMSSLNCEDCGTNPSVSCAPLNYYLFRGYLTNGHQCRTYIGRADGSIDQTKLEQVQQEMAQEQIAPTFDPQSRNTYWGYIGTTSRSPNAGRGNSVCAKLDACVNYTKADTYTVANQISWNACNSDCDSAQNGYCNDVGTNNGVTGVTAAACKDRCDCYIGLYNGATCEGL